MASVLDKLGSVIFYLQNSCRAEPFYLISYIIDTFEKRSISVEKLKRLHETDSPISFGLISAYRTGEAGLSRNTNKKRHTELIKYLNNFGYRWESAKGAWQSEAAEKGYYLENSVLVYDINFEDLKLFANYFDQDAVIYKAPYDTIRLFDFKNNASYPMTEKFIDVDQPRPRKRTLEEDELFTRFRDTELKYDFNFDQGQPLEEISVR